jgi:hypothetical protein
MSAALGLLVVLICLQTSASAAAAGDANRAQCLTGLEGQPLQTEASPGFRAFMPDCRAYELVTPPYTAGQAAIGSTGSPAMSANGERLLGVDYADFAGTGNEEGGLGELGAFYAFSRTTAGWGVESLDPPAAQYPRRRFNYVSADLSRSLWEAYVPEHSGEENFAAFGEGNSFEIMLREEAGGGAGRFVAVGPKTAPGYERGESWDLVVGASAELSHVFLSVGSEARQLWPGDDTSEGAHSLYEYSGTGQREPVLVGVSNEGAPPWEPGAGSLNDGARLESECGTSYDGVSADGEVVYFTALAAEDEVAGQKFCGEHEGNGEGTGPPVNELYARVGGSRTVKISAGQSAVFQGASEDGSRVFFSEGEALYEYDLDEERSTLIAASITGVAAIAREGTYVYFTSAGVLSGEPNGNGETAKEVAGNKLYVYDTAPQTELAPHGEQVAFVAGEPGGEFDATRDGQFLVFQSELKLKGTGDSSSAQQLFEYDAETEEVALVSVGASDPTGMIEASGPGPTQGTSGQSVSKTGTVVFVSPDQLAAGAVSGGENVYEYSAGEVYLISAGDEATQIPCSGCRSRLIGIDETGEDVFFWSADRLVPQDTDTQAAWYDARQEGGFPAPSPQPACAPNTCQGPLSAPPLLSGPAGSEVAAGGGNLAPPVPTLVSRPKPPSRAQKLAKALKACKKERKSERAACGRRARARYGPVRKKGKGKR